MEMKSSLNVSELLSIDALITRAQERGLNLKDQVKTNVTDAQADAVMDAHHPLFDISENDQRILTQIKQLTSELEHTLSLGELVEIRGKIVQNLKRT